MKQTQKKALLIFAGFALFYSLLILLPKNINTWLIVLIPLVFIGYSYLLGLPKSFKDVLCFGRFLFLPLLFNYGAILFIDNLLGQVFKVTVAVIVVAANYYLSMALRKVYDRQERSALTQRNLVITIGFLTVFFSLVAVFRFYIGTSADSDFRLPLVAVIATTMIIFYLVSYFLAWENGVNLKKFMPYNLVISILGGQIAWVSSLWVVNYPSFVKSSQGDLSGLPLPAVTLTIIFYFLWGIISHKADRTLTKNVLMEYFAVGAVFLFILYVTARWLPDL